MTPSPYAPPRAPIGSYGAVDVRTGEDLPFVCLKCGRTHEVARHSKMLMVLGLARLTTLAVALVGGVLVAVIRDPAIRSLAFLAAAAVAFGVRRLLFPRREMTVTLCVPCADRWATGVRWSAIFRAAIFGLSVAASAVMLLDGPVLGATVLATAILGSILGLMLLRMRSRIVVVKERKGDVATLALVHPDAVAAIRERRRAG